MQILYAATRYDYGKPENGLSFEHFNFFDPLHRLGHDIIYFDTMGLLRKLGRSGMNRRLTEVAHTHKPGLLFTSLLRHELDYRTIRTISRGGQTRTLNWFCDDHWRFEDFSRRWAPCFTDVVTTAASAVPKYEAMGYRNAIKSQWACNHFIYRKLDLPLTRQVTFVGQPHGTRRQVIAALSHAGIDVQVWGAGWEAGRLTQEQMIEVFNQSQINLNLSNSSARSMSRTRRWVDDGMGLAGGMISRLPGGRTAKKSMRRVLGMDKSTTNDGADPLAAPEEPNQIKGRNFEIPGCGGFTLTGLSENLEHYFTLGREVASYNTLGQLIERVRYYLDHEEERAQIAAAGYARTLAEHTYGHRFREIFTHMGLEHETGPIPGPDDSRPGRVEELV